MHNIYIHKYLHKYIFSNYERTFSILSQFHLDSFYNSISLTLQQYVLDCRNNLSSIYEVLTGFVFDKDLKPFRMIKTDKFLPNVNSRIFKTYDQMSLFVICFPFVLLLVFLGCSETVVKIFVAINMKQAFVVINASYI